MNISRRKLFGLAAGAAVASKVKPGEAKEAVASDPAPQASGAIMFLHDGELCWRLEDGSIKKRMVFV